MTTTATAGASTRPATDLALDAPRWGGPGHSGHYEVWYLTLHDPASRRALWLRHTLHAPVDGRTPGHAALWAFSFEPDGSGVQAIDHHPLWTVAFPAPGTLSLGPARLEPGAARGEVGVGARRVTWDLRFTGDGAGFRHVPPALYAARLAGSCVSTPALLLDVSGTVTVGDARWDLEHARGERGHVFGRRHADRWAWAHVHSFEGAPGAVLEGVSAQVQKAGFTLPVATPLLVRDGDLRLAWDGAASIWTPRVRSLELGRWEVEARRGDHRVRVTVTAPPEAFVSVEYADPDGGQVFCNHAETADAEVEVERRTGWRWERVRRLVARGSTALELGERGVRDPRPRRRMDLRDARAMP